MSRAVPKEDESGRKRGEEREREKEREGEGERLI